MQHDLDGVLLLNKPYGISSNIALQKVKRLYGAKKAGHTGTLDPLAQGLLPICFGQATKFAMFLLNSNKEYIATIKLGQKTSTYDREGPILATATVNCSVSDIQQCIKTFTGVIQQTPPIYSAIKVNGKALYKYARNNQPVTPLPREVTIHAIDMLDCQLPDFIQLRILCSKGTYIRSLANDIGLQLGCGAYLYNLVRVRAHDFVLQDDITLDKIQRLNLEEKHKLLVPMDSLVQQLYRLDINDNQFNQVKQGHTFIQELDVSINQYISLYYENKFLGVGINYGNNYIKPQRLINTTQWH